VRLFFAVDVPALPPWDPASARENAKPSSAPDHLTLRFLGEQPETRLADWERAGRAASAEVRPFEISLEEIGAFPSTNAPRIVWLGVGMGQREAVALERALSRALEGVGVPPETRPFVPHVTWRRVRSRADASRARSWLEKGTLPAPLRGRVDALLLRESVLSSSGAIHTTRATFPLGERDASAQDGSRPTSS